MNAVVERIEQPRAVATQAQVTPSQLLQLAMDKGVDLDRLEKLYALQREWEAHEARKAFIAAMAQFKENVPTILKDKHVSFETQKGVTEYDHATLGGVCEALIADLAKVGITHDWDPDTRDPARIAVTCTLTHVLGHSKSVTLHAAPDSSGGKNSIQAGSSTITYLERYSLLAVAGVATKDMPDDDGRSAGPADPLITEEQACSLEALMTEISADKAGFLKFCKVNAIRDLPARKYKGAMGALEERRRAK
jgi:hypothetical protein